MAALTITNTMNVIRNCNEGYQLCFVETSADTYSQQDRYLHGWRNLSIYG